MPGMKYTDDRTQKTWESTETIEGTVKIEVIVKRDSPRFWKKKIVGVKAYKENGEEVQFREVEYSPMTLPKFTEKKV